MSDKMTYSDNIIIFGDEIFIRAGEIDHNGVAVVISTQKRHDDSIKRALTVHTGIDEWEVMH